jgi:hypothetical protein
MVVKVSLLSGAVASDGVLSIQTNGTTEAISISTGQVATFVNNPILTGGTINGVAYLNASKVLTTGSALVFDATNTRLGIGVASPSYSLQVYNNINGTPFAWGNATRTGYLYQDASGTGITDGANTAFTNGVYMNTSNNSVGIYTNANTRATFDSAGNLGLGVTPTNAVDVQRTGSVQLRLKSASTGGATLILDASSTSGQSNQITFLNNGTSKWALGGKDIGSASGDLFSLYNYAASSNAFTVDTSGNFLVGTTSYNSTIVGILNSANGHLYATTNGIPAASFNRLTNDGTLVEFLRSSSVVGSVSVTTTGTTYNVISDYRLKNNQADLTDSGLFIDALQPKTWNWAQDGSKGVGFIAHEFAEVSPNSVSGEKDAVDADGNPIYQSMQSSSSEVIANLVAEIKSLRKRITALEAK